MSYVSSGGAASADTLDMRLAAISNVFAAFESDAVRRIYGLDVNDVSANFNSAESTYSDRAVVIGGNIAHYSTVCV